MTTELEFIDGLRRNYPARPPVLTGIGDDGAVLDCSNESVQIVVTDMLLDRTHFDLRVTSAALAGRKAVAVNLSDLAAMACRPTAAFVSLAMPRQSDEVKYGQHFARELYSGMDKLFQEYGFTLAGGDTNTWNGPFAINVCLVGVPCGKKAVLRSGARPGDVLFVTGPLGGSLFSGRHLTFRPKLQEAEWLAANIDVHAMMDISDGLSLDLTRLAAASGVAAIVDSDDVPIHSDVDQRNSPDRRLAAALNDGEDFELLFCVSPNEAEKMLEIARETSLNFFRIGRILEGAGCHLQSADGEISDINADGWQHSF